MPRLTNTSPAAREAHRIDIHVGRQIRHWRMLAGKSQEQLGDRLGLTFQQIQKYENGANRISAGRLLQIADYLGVGVECFFAGIPSGRVAKDKQSRG